MQIIVKWQKQLVNLGGMGNCQLNSQMTRFGNKIAQSFPLAVFVCAARRPENFANENANGLAHICAALCLMRLCLSSET